MIWIKPTVIYNLFNKAPGVKQDDGFIEWRKNSFSSEVSRWISVLNADYCLASALKSGKTNSGDYREKVDKIK